MSADAQVLHRTGFAMGAKSRCLSLGHRREQVSCYRER